MNLNDFMLQIPNKMLVGPMQILYDENASNQIIYAGFASRGTATSAASWFIVKIAYAASGNPSSEKTAPVNSIWDNRTTLTYA